MPPELRRLDVAGGQGDVGEAIEAGLWLAFVIAIAVSAAMGAFAYFDRGAPSALASAKAAAWVPAPRFPERDLVGRAP